MSVVVVIGGCGFIGRRVVDRLLHEGQEVVVLDRGDVLASLPDRPGLGKLAVDITDAATLTNVGLALRGVKSAVHLAAMAAPRLAEKNPGLTWSVNVHGTYNVLSMLRVAGVRRVVFASSAHVYGISPRYFPTDETHPLALQDQYTTSKILGERLCELFHQNHGMSYVALRFFNGYGPGQPTDYFIPAKIAQAKALQPGDRMVLRGRETTKDWVHVEDIAAAVTRALASDFVGPINIGTGIETSLGQIAKVIAARRDLVLDFDDSDRPTRMRCDASRAQSVLGWQPRVPFEDGLQSLLTENT